MVRSIGYLARYSRIVSRLTASNRANSTSTSEYSFRYSQEAAIEAQDLKGFHGFDLAFHAMLQDQLGFERVRTAAEAARLGLHERADVQDAMQRARRQILVQAMREEHIRGIPAPADADVKAHFDANAKNFKLAEAYRITAVEWTGITAEVADRVSKMVAAGKANTNTLVAANGKLVATGGENEWLNQNNIIPPVWEKLKTIKDGQQTYIQTNQVMVVFTRNGHRDERPATFEEAKGSAAQSLWNERRELSWRKRIEEMAKKIAGVPADSTPK